MGRRLTEVNIDFISLVKKGANQETIAIYKSEDLEVDPEYFVEVEKYISAAERAKIPAEDFAGPHKSFPIRNQQDVYDAARLIGHAKNPEAVKKKIIAIARRKGLKLPKTWEDELKKSYDGQEPEKGFLAKLGQILVKSFGGGGEEVDVEKGNIIDVQVDQTSFTSRIKSVDSNLNRAVNVLQEVMWYVIWNREDNGRELILKAIDEFKVYITSILDAAPTVQKSFFVKYEGDRLKEELSNLKSIAESISKSVETLEKGDEEKVEKTEFQEMLAPIIKSLEGLNAKVEGLEKAVPEIKVSVEEAIKKSDDAVKKTDDAVQKTDEAIKKSDVSAESLETKFAEVTKSLETVTKSLEELSERITKVEEARGLGNGATDVSKKDNPDDFWAGIL